MTAFRKHWSGKVTSQAIADHLGLTRQAVEYWLSVPAEYVLVLESFTGTPRYVIRPDLYPPEEYGPRRRHRIGEKQWKGVKGGSHARN